MGKASDIAILVINHREGVSAFACDSEETARAIIAQWVTYWWDQDMKIGQEMPENADEAVELYFESSRESYDIVLAGPLYTKANVARRMKKEFSPEGHNGTE